jgi:hypothetical protein
MRIINLPLPCYAPEGDGGGGASGPSSTPSAPSGGGSSPSTPSSPSGAASSPSSGTGATPSTPAPGSSADGSSSTTPAEENDFSALGAAEDFFDEPPAPEPTPEPEPPAPAAPAEPTAPAAAPAQGEPGTQPSGQPTGQPAQSSPPFSLDEPGKIAEALAQGEEQLVAHLAANDFKLSEKDLEALAEDAPSHIPTLLGRVYLKSQVNLMRQMENVVPRLIQKQVQVMRRSMEAENAFYSAWPGLDRVKHAPILQKYASLYRQANPQATREQMINDLGPIIAQAAGVPNPKIAANAAPGANGVHPRTPPQPFRPATPGVAAMPQPLEQNEWAGLGQAAPDEE